MTNQIYTLKYLNFNGVLPFNCNRILEGLFPINGCYILNFQIRKLDKIPIGNICKKLMVVMDLIIFIVFEVQANNNFISSSLFSSSLPIIHFSHSSQLDNIVPGPLYNCLDLNWNFVNRNMALLALILHIVILMVLSSACLSIMNIVHLMKWKFILMLKGA